MAKFRKSKGKGESNDTEKGSGKGKKGKGKDKIGELVEDDTYMDETEFAAWLHGSPDQYTYEGMQCLTERYGNDSAVLTVPSLRELDGAEVRGCDVTRERFSVASAAKGTGNNRAPEIIGMMTNATTRQACRHKTKRKLH